MRLMTSKFTRLKTKTKLAKRSAETGQDTKTLASKLRENVTRKICQICNFPKPVTVNYYSYSEFKMRAYNPAPFCACGQVTEE